MPSFVFCVCGQISESSELRKKIGSGKNILADLVE